MEIESALENLIGQTQPRERARKLRTFSARLFARLAPDLATRIGADRLLAIAANAFDFFSLRDAPIVVRVAPAGDAEAATIVLSTMRDRAFIVDSVLEYFHQLGAPVRMLLHPIFAVTRDAEGRLVSLEQNAAAEHRESLVYAELEIAGDSAPEIAAELKSRLEELDNVTADFEPMTARALAICDETAAIRELVEIRDLLRWMVHGGFVFLGYRRYQLAGSDSRQTLGIEPDSGLGILRSESRSRFKKPRPLAEIDPRERKLLFEGPRLIVGKTHALARVHRAAAMDDITIRRSGENDHTAGFDRFLGLFTSKARAEEAEHVPVLRGKLLAVLAAEKARPGSHDFKQIVAAFNSFPKEELFRASIDELRSQLGHILDLKTQVRLSLYPDSDRKSVIALVVMPRDRFSAEVRIAIQEALGRALGGPLVYYHLALGEGYAAQLHFCFSAPPPGRGVAAKLGNEVVRLARTWEDRLREQLTARCGEIRGRELASRWEHAFGPDYIATADAALAAGDIERFEAMLAGGAPEIELVTRAGADDSSQLRICELNKAPALSELMPMLQNFGIKVFSEMRTNYGLLSAAKKSGCRCNRSACRA